MSTTGTGTATSIQQAFSTATSSSRLLHDLIRNFATCDDSPSANGSGTRRRVLLLDGGTGEELIANGVPYDSKIWSARAITEDQYHKTVLKVHTSFIKSGCDAITTNSYGIVPGVGFVPSEIEQYCAVAGQIARSSVRTASLLATSASSAVDKTPIFILGSLGPLVESYRADNIMARSDGIESYTVAVQALQPYVDAFIAETLSSSEEAIQVVQSLSNHVSSYCNVMIATSNVTDTDVDTDVTPNDSLFISFTVNTHGRLRGNENTVTAISSVLDYQASNCPNVQLLGILFNCSDPESITSALQQIKRDASLLHRLRFNGIALGAYANRLTPISPISAVLDSTIQGSGSGNNCNDIETPKSTDSAPQPLRNDLSPEQYYVDFVQDWVTNYSVNIIGGCCGISPKHIEFLHGMFQCE